MQQEHSSKYSDNSKYSNVTHRSVATEHIKVQWQFIPKYDNNWAQNATFVRLKCSNCLQ
ncbi:hypothetical protein HAX54_032938, partial [Datura stramonium]|nr:hypothetical protein [Datura stramonium]